MGQPELDNDTDFEVHPQMLLDVDGEKLVVVVKASFELPEDQDELVIAPLARNRPVRPGDIPWGEPDVSSIGYPCDLCVRKPGTDVVVVGKGYAPSGRPLPSFDARVEVGPLSRTLRLCGPRVWTGLGDGMTDPSPIDALELRYELAWGGFDDSDPEDLVEEARNPIGRGMVRDKADRIGQPAPQIEDPTQLISSLDVDPAPAGVGAVGRHWMPRRRYAGAYDAGWVETRAPLPPADLDDRFNLFAPSQLHSATPLRGGEPVKLLNLLPGGDAVGFALPELALVIDFRVRGRQPLSVQPHLDTVLLDLLEVSEHKPAAVELVWRAAVKAPRRLSDARVVVREVEP